jgi:hypothetical protein
MIAGEPLEIFKDPIVLRNGKSNVQLSVDPGLTVYDQLEDRWRIMAATPGTYPISVSCDGHQKSATVNVVAPLDGGAPTRSVIFAGDSGAGATGGFPSLVKTSLGSQITLLGTQGSNPNKTEAYPGRSYDFLAHDPTSAMTAGGTVPNIPSFLATIGATPSFIHWSCFSNDMASVDISVAEAAAQFAVDNLEQLIDAWIAAAPTVKHIIGTIWPGNVDEAAWEATYPLAPIPVRWLWRQKLHIVLEALFARLGDREDELIFINHTDTGLSTNTGHIRTSRFIRHALVAHW